MLRAEHTHEPRGRRPSSTTTASAVDPRYRSLAETLLDLRPLAERLRAVDAAIEDATAPLRVGARPPRGWRW